MDPQQFAAMYALTTSIGLRAFTTLALASLAMHFGYLHPSPAFAWLGSDGATAALAALALVELGSDKIPIVDHFVHAIHFATKPVAAAVLVGSLMPDAGASLGPADYAAMGAGALNALGVHTVSATARGASTVTTAGFANPLISTVEDGVAVAGTALAIFLPILAAVGALALTVACLFVARRIWRTGVARSPARSQRGF